MRRKVTQQPDRVPPLLANRMLLHPVREWIDKGSRIRQEETGPFEQCRIGADYEMQVPRHAFEASRVAAGMIPHLSARRSVRRISTNASLSA